MTFFIPGRPRSTQTGSIVRVRGRAFPVRRNTPWSAYCSLMARQCAPERPIEGPILYVRICFFLRRPKRPRCPYPIGRPDVDNLAKGLTDSWNGILWYDDSQIIDLSIGKRYADTDHPEGVLVEVCDEVLRAGEMP